MAFWPAAVSNAEECASLNPDALTLLTGMEHVTCITPPTEKTPITDPDGFVVTFPLVILVKTDVTFPSNSEQCGGICIANPSCTHFTYSGGNCFLKRITGSLHERFHSGAVCGFILGRSRQPI
uniref:Apple domain-containing protein n=1 Tax=Daphnia galeata TaxID=27404 RepID=A0A8J2S466_9CRUS|nr:unnamed protein product [Daphnia galeata]